MTPAIGDNGAAGGWPRERRLIEERVLSDRTLHRAVDFGEREGYLTVAMCAGVKYAMRPRGEVERLALRDMTGLTFVEPETLRGGRVIRVTLFSDRHPDSGEFARTVESFVDQPVYVTHFPLKGLADNRETGRDAADTAEGRMQILLVVPNLEEGDL